MYYYKKYLLTVKTDAYRNVIACDYWYRKLQPIWHQREMKGAGLSDPYRCRIKVLYWNIPVSIDRTLYSNLRLTIYMPRLNALAENGSSHSGYAFQCQRSIPKIRSKDISDNNNEGVPNAGVHWSSTLEGSPLLDPKDLIFSISCLVWTVKGAVQD